MLYGDVNLHLQINNRIFAAVHKLLTNHVDSLSWYFIIVYNCFKFYHFSIICMTYCYILGEELVSCQNLFLVLLNNSIKYVQNKNVNEYFQNILKMENCIFNAAWYAISNFQNHKISTK